MKMVGIWTLVAGAALVVGCAGTVPSELAGARVAYRHASEGPAARLAPVDLHNAQQALAEAEKSYSKHGKSYQARDLAYVAQRKAELADVQASIAAQQESKAHSDDAFQATQGKLLQQKTEDLGRARTELADSKRSGAATAEQLASEQSARRAAEGREAEQSRLTQETARDLNQSRTALALSEQSGQATAGQLAAEQKARLEAEARTSEAQAALAKLSALKEDERGMVITLSGSVLFRSGEATLMPGADARLDQVADALSPKGDRNVRIEGYTDSQGSDQYNLDLSQRRANAVRDYLVHSGYPSARVQAQGLGEARPVADNGTTEGRANNRRVEIILERTAVR